MFVLSWDLKDVGQDCCLLCLSTLSLLRVPNGDALVLVGSVEALVYRRINLVVWIGRGLVDATSSTGRCRCLGWTDEDQQEESNNKGLMEKEIVVLLRRFLSMLLFVCECDGAVGCRRLRRCHDGGLALILFSLFHIQSFFFLEIRRKICTEQPD